MFLDAKNENSRKYFFYHQDGLLDLFVGLMVVLAGVSLLAEMFWMAGVWVAIFTPLWISARSSITYPRVAVPETPSGRDTRYLLPIAVLIGLLMLSLTVGLAFFVGFERFPAFRAFLNSNILLVLGAGLATMLLVPAIFMQVRRYYAYAALAMGVFALGQLLGWAFWTAMIVVGGLLTLVGIGILRRFLHAHPLQHPL